MKLLLQMLGNSDSEQERQTIIADLVASNNRAIHLIEQLLRLARVSHHPLNPNSRRPALHLVASVLAEFGNIITSRQLDVLLEGDETGAGQNG